TGRRTMDLIVKNGLIVSDGLEFTADLGIRGGVIKVIGDLSGMDARQVVDCSGRIVLPGAVDLGVNLFDNGAFDPESGAGFALASRQAALGGVTTIITAIETVPAEGGFLTIKAEQDADSGKAHVDLGYHLLVSVWDATMADRARVAV